MKSVMICFLLLANSCLAQEYPTSEIDLARLANEFFGYQEVDENSDEIYDNIIQLLNNPLDLNRASPEDFQFLSFLSEAQIQSIIAHRNIAGDFLSVYELQSVPNFDNTTIYKIIPFVKIYDAPTSVKDIISKIAHDNNNYVVARVERTLEEKKGFNTTSHAEDRFRGSPNRLYLRLRSSKANNYSIGITTEKDAGEQFTWNPRSRQYGLDYWSAHVQLKNRHRIKNFVAGDFQSQFGQGLILGGAFGAGKGAETVLAVRKSSIGFVPYSSVNEVSFSRGLAATFQMARNVEVSALLSSVRRDATTSADTTELSISSLGATGMHRNSKELEGRSKVGEQQAGVIITYKQNRFDAGIVCHLIKFRNPIHRRKNQYNQFAFDGSKNQNVGIFMNFNFNNFTFFSEAAKTLGGGSAIIVGGIGSLGDNFDISLLFRKYSRNFFTFNSNAFAETVPQNETGFYWGWKYRIGRKNNLSGYVDIFRFPWLRFRTYSPSAGHEWYLQFSYQPSRQVQVFAQVREESKERNLPGDAVLYPTGPGIKRNFAVNIDYGIGLNLHLSTRALFSTFSFDQRTSNGFALLQDISVGLNKLKLTMRYSLFDTEDFDNRQYVYENDVWLAYSMQAYYGTGTRRYVLVEYKVNKRVSLWFRFSTTGYSNQENIGSGLDAIPGNERNDVKFQARIKF